MNKLLYLVILVGVVACNSGSKNTAVEKQPVQTVKLTETTVNIGGMHCANCAASVEKGIKGLEGVQTVVVSLEDSTAKISFDPAKVDVNKISKAVEGRGYYVKAGK